ncbi:MAG: peptide chain release factor N(5)-glutamine methyltransferase [Flavitalea sp.]
MTITEANQKLLFQLYYDYDDREAGNIADWIMENLTGWKKIDRVLNNTVRMSSGQELQLQKYIDETLLHKPVQYILNEAWFCGLKLYVDENVLIPRPETEELAEWIIAEKSNKKNSVLDIGTGSGCIAVALKNKVNSFIVNACDISGDALQVAQKNADTYQSEINFYQNNILDKNTWSDLPSINIIVSNPPYIPAKEKIGMNKNVTLHEPGIALFVANDDPLIFYKTIIDFAKEKLIVGGSIFVEIHEDLSAETSFLFKNAGYKNVAVKKDMQGKNRMIRAY